MILDGRELSKEIKENIKSKVALLDKKPRIDFIYFENDKSTEIYFNRAKKSAENAGMIGALHNLNSNTSEKDFLTLIEYLNEEKETNGIMIQAPLPKHIDKKKVYETISPDKDVDAISNISLGRIFLGESKLIPCTVKSVMALLKGLTVVLANEDEQRNPKLMAKLILDSSVDMIQITPSRMQLLLNYDKELSCLRNVSEIMIGGEPFPLNLLRTLKNKTTAKIYNMYGPTETTIWSTVSNLTHKDRIDIGYPIKNTEVYIVD